MTRKVQPARRHGEIGPEAKLGAVRIGEDVGPCAQAFADDVEEHVGRLDDRRRNGFIAGFGEDRHQNVCACASSASRLPRRLRGHRRSILMPRDELSDFVERGSTSGTENCAGRAAFHSLLSLIAAAAFAPSIRSLIVTSPLARSSEPWMIAHGALRLSAYFICAFMPGRAEIHLGADTGVAQRLRHFLIASRSRPYP